MAELPKTLVLFNSYADTAPEAGPDQIRDESGAVVAYPDVERGCGAELVRRYNEHPALMASRVFWVLSVREAIRRGDVEVVRQNAINHETFVTNLQTEVDRLKVALQKVSDIRDSIVGMQGFNFSEHAYPLVAILDAAGFEGKGYEIARKNLGTLIDQTKAAESERDVARAQVEELIGALTGLMGERRGSDEIDRAAALLARHAKGQR